MRPATLAEVAERLRAGEPAAKAYAEFLDDFYRAPDRAAAASKLNEEPAPTGDAIADAMLAAVADYLSVQFTRAPPPDWTSSQRRILAEPHFTTVSNAPEMKEWLVFSSPAEFKRHNIFTESRPLRRKMSERVAWASAAT